MAFFTSTDEYKMPETWKAYSEYQLEDSCFVYEDPDSEDSLGAFYPSSSCVYLLHTLMPSKDTS
jgi:hypothetical protein